VACGGVRQKRSVPTEEWFFLFNWLIDRVENQLHSVAANCQAHISLTTSWLAKARSHTMRKTTQLVKIRPPFTALVAQVARFAQQVGNARQVINVGNNQLSGILTRFPRLSGIGFGSRSVVSQRSMLLRIQPS